METHSKSNADVDTDHTALEQAPRLRMRRAMEVLDSTKDVYAQELSKLRILSEGVPTKQALQIIKGSPDGTTELPPCPTLLQTLLQQREILSKDLHNEKARCEELQKQLEQAHAETLEAQMCVNVLNETVRMAFQGEKILVERNRHLVSDHQVLASKLVEVSKTRLPDFQNRIKGIEAACNSMKQDEIALQLYNKVCMRGLWVFVELVFFCHATLWVLLRTVEETYSFAPT